MTRSMKARRIRIQARKAFALTLTSAVCRESLFDQAAESMADWWMTLTESKA